VANSLALGTSPIVRALIDPEGGMRDVRALDSVSFTDWFKGHGGSQASIDRMWCALRGATGAPDVLLAGLPRHARCTDRSIITWLAGVAEECHACL
jgi:hypothetical protein